LEVASLALVGLEVLHRSIEEDHAVITEIGVELVVADVVKLSSDSGLEVVYL
jgi:hypothetical protein